MGITLGHKYRWNATTETNICLKYNNIVQGKSIIFDNCDEVMG